MGTLTTYNSLGQVTATARYSGVIIPLGSHSVDGVSFAITTAPTGMTLISSTASYYDELGRVIESDTNINPVGVVGLRTGTVYDFDGQVEYTGPLNGSAPAGGHVIPDASGDTTYAFTAADFASDTNYLYNQYGPGPSGDYFYDVVTNPNGNVTKTYKDSAGRTVYTVDPDGTYTETIYSDYGHSLNGSDIDPGAYEVEKITPEIAPYVATQ